MSPTERAELVRAYRFEMKQARPRFGRETAEQYVQRTAEGGDASYADAAQRWDDARAAAPKGVRRTTRSAHFFAGDYAYGYHGRPRTGTPGRGRFRVSKQPSNRITNRANPKLAAYGTGDR